MTPWGGLRALSAFLETGGIDWPSRSSLLRPITLSEGQRFDFGAFVPTLNGSPGEDRPPPPSGASWKSRVREGRLFHFLDLRHGELSVGRFIDVGHPIRRQARGKWIRVAICYSANLPMTQPN